MSKDTYIKLMNGSYCQQTEIPDYSDKDFFIPVLQKPAKFIKKSEDEFCSIATKIIGIYDDYIIYNDHISFNDNLDEYGENLLTLYNFRDFTSTHCSGNSLIWKRGQRTVIVDFDNKEIISLNGEERCSLDFEIPICRTYPFVHWDFNGIIDCVANGDDLVIQIRDAWERPESHTLIIHSTMPNDNRTCIGTFEITHDQDTKLMGRLQSIKDSKVYIKRLCNEKSKLCVFDLYGNLIYEIDEPSKKDEWIKEQNEISYKVVISLSSSMFVEYKNVKRNFIPIAYNMEGFPDVRFLQTRLKSDGLLKDNKPYYVQWYWNISSNESYLSRQLSEISLCNGLVTTENTQYFESMKFKTIAKSIFSFRKNLQPEHEVVVWIPYDISHNETPEITELRKTLNSCSFNCITGNNCIIPETDSKRIVFIIDFKTDKQRQISLANKVVLQCPNNEPVIVMISFMKIIDELDLIYLKAVHKLQRELNISRRKSIVKSSYDEETAIMNALAGHGPDPEFFGF
ncbi:MAG: hypothetical protein Q4D33_01410 [Prevotellaceae bacterium]|nr:hypothetical protein [Prevotellaceae bacterium]